MDDQTKSSFINAVKYIYDHIDQPVTIEEIASKAHTSVSTLKRIFQEATDQNPGTFMRRLRMEYAFRSLRSKHESVLEVALSVGFDDHSAFSRRFKETFGYAPTLARQKINIVSELEHVTLDEPEIVELEPIHMQSVTEQGLYFECAPKAWAELKKNLSTKEVSEEFSGVFIGIGHDNPHDGDVAENEVRFSAGVCFAENKPGLDQMTIAGGPYARFRYFGKVMNLGVAYHYIYGAWNEKSGHEVRADIPAFITFDGFPKIEGEQRILIHVPLMVRA